MTGNALPIHVLVLGPLIIVPLIAMALIWGRRQTERAGAPDRRDMRAMWREISPKQRWQTVALGAGFIVFLLSLSSWKKDVQEDILRRQFILPANIELAALQVSKRSSEKYPAAEAIVRFTDAQFRSYARKIEDPSNWRPTQLSYGGLPVESYSEVALRWRDSYLPAFAGDRRARWGNLSRQEVANLRNGRVLCFVLLRHPAGSPALFFDEAATHYTAHACWELDRSETTSVLVMGALDYDTKTLHMIIR